MKARPLKEKSPAPGTLTSPFVVMMFPPEDMSLAIEIAPALVSTNLSVPFCSKSNRLPVKVVGKFAPTIVPLALPEVRPRFPIRIERGNPAFEKVVVPTVSKEGGVEVPIPALVAEFI